MFYHVIFSLDVYLSVNLDRGIIRTTEVYTGGGELCKGISPSWISKIYGFQGFSDLSGHWAPLEKNVSPPGQISVYAPDTNPRFDIEILEFVLYQKQNL